MDPTSVTPTVPGEDSPLDGDLAPGTAVNEYVIDGKLGQGGFGAVFKATHPVIGKVVAIKVTLAAFDVTGATCTLELERPGRLRVLTAGDRVVIVGIGQPAAGAIRPAQVFSLAREEAGCRLARDGFVVGSTGDDPLQRCVDLAVVEEDLVALCEVGARRFVVRRFLGVFTTLAPPPPIDVAEVDGIGLQLLTGDFDGDSLSDLAIGTARAGEVGVQLLRQCPAHDTRDCR